MFRPRLIPCLLLTAEGIVKTVKFQNPSYIGDALNIVKIFNEKKVDELFIIDLNVTTLGTEIQYETIKVIARECRMPLCYGGGIKNISQAKKIFEFGVEKIAISSAVIQEIKFLETLAKFFGTQSVTVVLDIKKDENNNYKVFTHSGTRMVEMDILELIKVIQNKGAGEIVINSIDNDGMMNGYNFDLIDQLFEHITIPLTILGGVGADLDLKYAYKKYGNIGYSCGSFFIYKGNRKAVLLNYPNEKLNIFKNYKE